ncbi:acetylornithine deacetylase / succinyl-diaminopimelate desuccinylase [Ligilactobacillus salitolerans]|uniref:Acetylornithine deacetylase / succinyl-diaminopimelate desuccinylase n=1 Tax=Ligilactobacillus salitolerans TaxID=1808352 RepID=A0A401IQE3_9LACO|nr:M20/M25/M40 family metallo-hydrolase [Ligilactobacillus salitolerans]GBG93759.1 acetylornithine deacetylase / succinyl-diaminopimelate desuccinylase [Ligilactobacillus salitolerans]
MTKEQQFKDYVMDRLPEYYDYLRIPGVSAQGTGIDATVDWLKNKFAEVGAKKVEVWHELGGNPVVYAEFAGHSDKTVLFYNHYDVQPPEPLDEWESEPFEPTERAGKLYARGVADDKGELISRLAIIQYYQENGGLPSKMKFVVEGQEEVGSPTIQDYVHAHKEQLAADACIWEGGGKDANEAFQITAGLKGVVSFDMTVETAEKDLHSSTASYADNAAWRLVQALNSLKDASGQVLVAGFYDDVKPLEAAAQKAVEEMEFNGQAIKEQFGLKRPFVTDKPAYALINTPTMTINGLSSGYEGAGVKTVIPRRALAKFDCRLVPDQEPRKIFNLIRAHLDQHGFEDVKITFNIGEPPFRTSLEDPFVKLNIETAQEIYGAEHTTVIPNSAGSGPAAQFVEELGVPLVEIGIGYGGNGPHAPNEHIRLQDYRDGSWFLYQLLNKYAVK